MITGDQVRAARKLLRWSQLKLAFTAGVDPGTVAQFEIGGRRTKEPMILAMRKTLESAGVEFTQGEPGVRLRKGNDHHR